MDWKSTAVIGVVSGTVVTLLATAAPSPDRQRHPVASPQAIDPQQGAALIAETAKLRERLRSPVVPSASTRNPFAFAAPAAAPRIVPAEPVESVAAPRPLDSDQQPLPFTLVGLAADGSSGSMVVTAILSSPGSLQFVKQGDRVDGGYRVAAITAESVELTGDDGRSLLLWLK